LHHAILLFSLVHNDNLLYTYCVIEDLKGKEL